MKKILVSILLVASLATPAKADFVGDLFEFAGSVIGGAVAASREKKSNEEFLLWKKNELVRYSKGFTDATCYVENWTSFKNKLIDQAKGVRNPDNPDFAYNVSGVITCDIPSDGYAEFEDTNSVYMSPGVAGYLLENGIDEFRAESVWVWRGNPIDTIFIDEKRLDSLSPYYGQDDGQDF